MKRKKSSEEQIRILGVLAYIRAFKHIIGEKVEASGLDPKKHIPYFDDDATKDSITATRVYLEAVANKKKAKSDNIRTVVLWLAAFGLTMFSFVAGFADTKVKPDWFVQMAADYSKANAWLGFVPILGVAIWWTSNLVAHRPWVMMRDLIRVAVAHRRSSIAILLTACILLTWLAITRSILIVGYFSQ